MDDLRKRYEIVLHVTKEIMGIPGVGRKELPPAVG
jgi:hypothetical protein